jgi:phosphoribosylformimino-5-aminoimidazole carboxamide ribotide isomerase
MYILPSIDIKDGKVVRLRQGDFSHMTVFSNAPVDMARAWQEEGATWLHVVDLDGSLAGHPVNTDVVLQIRQAVGLHVQVGGGLRGVDDIAHLIAQGIDRVVLGTAALENPALLRDLVEIWGEKIVVALDARDGQVATQGWTVGSSRATIEVAAEMAAAGVRRLLYTDIRRDGMLDGPDLAGLAALHQAAGADVGLIASGGIATLDHLRALRDQGLEGAIIGSALYTGALKLSAAIKAVQ